MRPMKGTLSRKVYDLLHRRKPITYGELLVRILRYAPSVTDDWLNLVIRSLQRRKMITTAGVRKCRMSGHDDFCLISTRMARRLQPAD